VGSHKIKAHQSLPIIREFLDLLDPYLVISGRCPRGGVDIHTEDECKRQRRLFQAYPPKENNWEYGFMPRNMQMVIDGTHFLDIEIEGQKRSGGYWVYQEANKLNKKTWLRFVN
jgi:hypothetical protein